ncbi:CHC2 zinc finger domain-containing protein [Sporosarcina psychrophila]|uniref:DNA primase n=1 Tax=Sporosarcina psychrophila TaxID=1476 RepID=A0ABV2KAF9_SPOPS
MSIYQKGFLHCHGKLFEIIFEQLFVLFISTFRDLYYKLAWNLRRSWFMSRISQETIEQVKAVPILELAEALGDQPRRAGKQYNVCCPNPQHNENTPDTFIEPNKNIFKCFGGGGCGAGGNNSISYFSWHEFDGYDPKQHFLKSIRGIAELMGIPIKTEDGKVIKPGNEEYKPRKTGNRCNRYTKIDSFRSNALNTFANNHAI